MLYVACENGVIKDHSGKTLAFFDRVNHTLKIEGVKTVFSDVEDDEHAFYLIAHAYMID